MTDKDKALEIVRNQDNFLNEVERKASFENIKLCNIMVKAKLEWKLFASDSYKLSDELKSEIRTILDILEDANISVACSQKKYGNIADVILSTLDEKNVAISLDLKKIIINLFQFKCFFLRGKFFSCPRKNIYIREKIL